MTNEYKKVNIPLNMKLNRPNDFLQYVSDLYLADIEDIIVCGLTKDDRVIYAYHVAYNETEDDAWVSFRKLFKQLLTDNVYKIIMVHNHPHSDPLPSLEDISLTQDLLETCVNLDIEVADHFIVSLKGSFSFKEWDMLDLSRTPQEEFDKVNFEMRPEYMEFKKINEQFLDIRCAFERIMHDHTLA